MGMLGFLIYEFLNDTVSEEGLSFFLVNLLWMEIAEVEEILAGSVLAMHNVR
jgi:hypothetical protein